MWSGNVEWRQVDPLSQRLFGRLLSCVLMETAGTTLVLFVYIPTRLISVLVIKNNPLLPPAQQTNYRHSEHVKKEFQEQDLTHVPPSTSHINTETGPRCTSTSETRGVETEEASHLGVCTCPTRVANR